MSTDALRQYLTKKLAVERGDAERFDRIYRAETTLAYVDPEVLRIYKDRVVPVNVNLGRLVVDSIAQRLQVTGFRSATADVVDNDLLALWRSLGMDEQSQIAHPEALVTGRAFFMVWAVGGEPVVTVESPTQVTVTRDPVTRKVAAALKRYVDAEGYTRSVVMTADTIDTYVSRGAASPTAEWDVTPNVLGEDLVLDTSAANPMRVVPVVCLPNRPRVSEPDGVSELVDLEPLLKAIGKLGSDLMVASESLTFPHRFLLTDATVGREQAAEVRDLVQESLTKPGPLRVSVAGGGSRLGEITQASIDNFDTAIRLYVNLAASIGALPPYYVSADVANPTSADAIRASESRLTARALERQRWWGSAYAELIRLAQLARDGVADPGLDDLQTLWMDPAPASEAQEADAAVELLQGGVYDRQAALESLDTPPLETERLLGSEPAQPVQEAS